MSEDDEWGKGNGRGADRLQCISSKNSLSQHSHIPHDCHPIHHSNSSFCPNSTIMDRTDYVKAVTFSHLQVMIRTWQALKGYVYTFISFIFCSSSALPLTLLFLSLLPLILHPHLLFLTFVFVFVLYFYPIYLPFLISLRCGWK
jgi:hypothetical protein